MEEKIEIKGAEDYVSLNKKTDNSTLAKKKEILKKKQKYKKDKESYFNYYDDIKVGSHKVVDW